jgi:hypothetical protein
VQLLAHGLGGIRDLPVPGWLFLFGGALVLVVSFVALGILWTEPRLAPGAGERPLSPRWQRLLAPGLRIALQTASLALFALVWSAAAFGEPRPIDNLAPTFVYVVFWLGLLPLVVLLGDVWRVLNPWRAATDLFVWLTRGCLAPPAVYPERLGRWPAAVLLAAFTALELTYYEPASPRALAAAIAVYSVATWTGAALFGREPWFGRGDGFSVYFGLLGRISPFAARRQNGGSVLVRRRPFADLTAVEPAPGTLAVVAVMLGSVAFDGFSNTTFWLDRTNGVRARFADDLALADLADMVLSLAGLIAAFAFVALVYRAAVRAAEAAVGSRRPLTDAFVGSLVPIALVYAVAHYFSYLVVQGQFAIPLLSDPFGLGWDAIGTADFRPRLDVLSPNTTWYVQVSALVAGHVAALVIAHDRALMLAGSTRTAARTQYAMLTLMVMYTVGGMWLLSIG